MSRIESIFLGAASEKILQMSRLVMISAAGNMALIVFLILFVMPAGAAAKNYNSYAIFYGAEIDTKKMSHFDLIIVDPKAKVDIPELHCKNTEVFAYLSLGEINKAAPEYEKFNAGGIIVKENPNWPGSFYIDADSELWRNYILNEAVPALAAGGYDGIFLDTLDSPLVINDGFFGFYKNGTPAVCEIIRKIRELNPKLGLMANNFEEHADEIGNYVNAFNVESLFCTYNFRSRKYERCDAKYSDKRVKRLQKLKKDYNVQIFVTDYAANSNYRSVRRLYDKIKRCGFVPYVSEISLVKLNRHVLNFAKRAKK